MRTAATQGVIVVTPRCGDPGREIGGLSLLERLCRQLSALESIHEIVLVSAGGRTLPQPSERVTTPVVQIEASGDDSWSILHVVAPRLGERSVIMEADVLVDERILAWLAEQRSDVLVRADSRACSMLLGSVARSTMVDSSSRRDSAVQVSVSGFPTYWPERRGDVPVHCLRVVAASDADEAWTILLDHVQKRALDLPARYFDPPLEGLLVRLLCATSITPNQVTVATGVVGFAVAALFGFGWLRLGVLLAIVVEVLDGVDGKLARIERRTSQIGELEHVLDFVYETSWYAAIGLFLASSGIAWALRAGMLIIACDVVDNLLNLAFARAHRQSLAEATPALRRFRLVSGRRNIYAWLFLPGFLVGWPAASFGVAAAWAGVTVAVHTIAAAWITIGARITGARIRPRSPNERRRVRRNSPRVAHAGSAGRGGDVTVQRPA